VFHETIATVICVTALTLCVAATASAQREGATEQDPLLAPPGQCRGDDVDRVHHRIQRLAMHCLIRHLRREAGLRRLHSDADLRRSAIYKARRIAACKTFTHYPCGDAFAEPFRRAQVTRRGRWIVGEDLAWGVRTTATARSVLSHWLASKTHRAVLLDDRFSHVGVRRRRLRMEGAPRGAVLWVAHLGRHARR
jgi:uncharacterized protein YkwD